MSGSFEVHGSNNETLGKEICSESDSKIDGNQAIPDSGLSNNPPLPKGCRPLAHQVAGHRYGKGRLGIGMLQHCDGSIMKPLQPPPRGEREKSFYERAFSPTCSDPVLITLRPFLPKLLGVWSPPIIDPETEADNCPLYSYLKLEDVCRRFRNPSILDIKIGRVSYDPGADAHKREAEISKYPPLSQIGFQLLGMRISRMTTNEAIFYDKHYGRSLSIDGIHEGLHVFLSGNLAWKKYIVKAFIQRLEMILSWFESQTRFQFYASSLLFIYEGEFLDPSSDSDEDSKLRKMTSSAQPDNYLHAVNSFINTTPQAPTTTEGGEEPAAVVVDKQPSRQRPQSAGLESGYSSEAETRGDASNKFVLSLSRRIQESASSYSKYRFPPSIVDVRMIDFAHVYEEQKRDDNYIYGLQNLIRYFREVLQLL